MKPKKLTKITFNLEAFTFIDLGLQSSRLWATENAPDHYTFSEAVETFGTLLPSSPAMVELFKECECIWNDEKKGLDITGPNGNTIFLPAAGYTRLSPDVKAKNIEGDYWTRTLHGQTNAYNLLFSADDLYPLFDNRRRYGFSVRLCKE